MDHFLLKRAREGRFFRQAVRDLAAELPPEDEALDRLIADTVTAGENEAFVRIVFAALGAGRPVNARHLAGGSSLFDNPEQLAAAALHMTGDVSRALTGAVEAGRMSEERDAAALLVAAVWCRRNGNAACPAELITAARLQARRAGRNPLVDLQLSMLSELIADASLSEILDSRAIPHVPGEVMESVIAGMTGPPDAGPLDVVPEQPDPILHSGFTMRRAVRRIGRNEPCPCGSGRKYKKCCLEKDRERLQKSSSVPGLTVDELREQRERFLTPDDLLGMRSYELARLDPMKVDPALRPILVNRLLLYGEIESAVELFEKLGIPEDLAGHWLDSADRVVASRRKDLLVRLMNVHGEAGSGKPDLPVAADLLLADDMAALRMIEDAAHEGLQDPDGDEAVDLAYALLEGRWPALGILVSRGLIAHKPPLESGFLLDALLETRDRLGLPPTDPLESVLDERFRESVEAYRDSALEEAHERLEVKNRELGAARAKLARIEAELERKERDTGPVLPADSPPDAAPGAIDPRAVDELRRRVASLKEELKERHGERNYLRRELHAALEDVERLEGLRRKEDAAPDAEQAERDEEGLLDDAEPMGLQPVRLPEFSKKFVDSIEPLPPAAVRHAMALIGRLAAGEARAFAGAKRLRADREIVRQRVQADYRLLFRIHPGTLELLALIPRRDLERKIRNLTVM